MQGKRSIRHAAVLVTIALQALAVLASDGDHRKAHQFNAWTQAGAQLQVAPRWWATGDLHWRRSEGFSAPMQLGVLLAPEYRWGRWSAQPGYAFWNTQPYGAFRTPGDQPEHRTWLQLGMQHPFGGWTMDHRLRNEQRFLERYGPGENGPIPVGKQYVGRLRYRTRVVAPLNDRKGQAGEWQAVLQQEVMLRHGDPGMKGLFDQVRPGVLLGYRPVRNLQFTAGYQLQYFERPNGMDVEYDHTLMLGALWRLPRKAKDIAPAPPPALSAY